MSAGTILSPKVETYEFDEIRTKENASNIDADNIINIVLSITDTKVPKILVAAPSTKIIWEVLSHTSLSRDLFEMGYVIMHITSKHGAYINHKKVSREVFFEKLTSYGKDDNQQLIVFHYSILSEGINCPELSGATYSNLTSPLNVRALNFNGQYLQRVDQKTGKLSENPQGILGCYKHFSANTGYDARWDVGVIDYINGKLKWTNDAGASWDLIADFSNFRFLTNETNPYFPASFLIERSFDPKTGDSSSCKQFKRQGIGFPLNYSGIISNSNPILNSNRPRSVINRFD
jgi:hypothetical protein